jgi:ABC-type nitrate/sulfonate/bicarbonate transport system substrate-binding protein
MMRAWLLLLGLSTWAGPAVAADTIQVLTTGKGAPVEWALHIAQAKGFFTARGVVVESNGVPSAAAAMQQLTAGSGDIGIGGITDPIRAIDHGAKLKLVWLETAIPPYSVWAQPADKSWADLHGKTVIVGGATDITRIYFERMAAPNGLKPGDYDLIYAGTTPARYAALASGAVAAAILYPPASFAAPGAGFSKLGELGDYVKDMPFTAMAANAAWADAHPAALVNFLSAIRAATVWFYQPANRAEAIAILLKESGAKPDDVDKTYDYFTAIHIFPEDGTIRAQTIATLVTALGETKELAGPADPARFIDPAMTKLTAEVK